MTPSPKKPFVAGLIGGIGSGKSAVASAFARRGARLVGADELGHEALRQPAIREEVVNRWGAGLLDAAGQIDRKKLAGIVFANVDALAQLEALTHPFIRQRVEEEIARAGAEGIGLVVVDAALLLEAGWHGVCDRLVYVDAPDEVRRERVARTRGWTTRHLEERESAQLPLTQKRARADHVVDNSSTLEHLGRQVDDLLHRWGLVPAESAPREPPPLNCRETSRT